MGTSEYAVAASAAYVWIAKEALSSNKTLSAEYLRKDYESSEILIYMAIGKQTEWYNIGIDENNVITGGCFALSNPNDFQVIIMSDEDINAICLAYKINDFINSEYTPNEDVETVIDILSANRTPSEETLNKMSITSRALLLQWDDFDEKNKQRIVGKDLN